MEAIYSPNQDLAIYYDISPKANATTPILIKAGEGFILMTAIDIDGDGLDEILKMNYCVNFSV